MAAELSLAPEILSSVERALAEDIRGGDATTNSIVSAEAEAEAIIIAKDRGVVAGLEVARIAFELVNKQVGFRSRAEDGEVVSAGQTVAELRGPSRAILTGERTALNFLGRMSGIATSTRQFVDAVSGTNARILDTRKTAPNLRSTDKMAVRLGGGQNHRFGLYDMMLIKDNHIDFAGSITKAVELARQHPEQLTIEVEARTLADLTECLDLGISWIMLDNMSVENMRQAVALTAGRAKLEASGNVSLNNVRQIAQTGVDFISVGEITHSARVLDLSLKLKQTGSLPK
jgi:nicotinate-nucleotide pyrophosphorylase (carboxylating)